MTRVGREPGVEDTIAERLQAGTPARRLMDEGFSKSTVYKVRAELLRGRGLAPSVVKLHRLLDRVIAKGSESTHYADILLRALAGELTQAETVAATSAYDQLYRAPWRVLLGINELLEAAPPRQRGTITEVKEP